MNRAPGHPVKHPPIYGYINRNGKIIRFKQSYWGGDGKGNMYYTDKMSPIDEVDIDKLLADLESSDTSQGTSQDNLQGTSQDPSRDTPLHKPVIGPDGLIDFTNISDVYTRQFGCNIFINHRNKYHYCTDCDKQVKGDCGHISYGRLDDRIDLSDGPTYWCWVCYQQQNKNCYHQDFGKKENLLDMTPGKIYYCGICKDFVDVNCGHRYYGNKLYLATEQQRQIYNMKATNPLSKHLELIFKPHYYCFECNKIINKDCGHGFYGNSSHIRDMTPGKKYSCDQCGVVDHNCGHYDYGDYQCIVENIPGSTYWCLFCCKQITSECGHQEYGRWFMRVDMSPGKVYWCNVCRKQVVRNCGHYYYGNSDYRINIRNERQYLKQSVSRMKEAVYQVQRIQLIKESVH